MKENSIGEPVPLPEKAGRMGCLSRAAPGTDCKKATYTGFANYYGEDVGSRRIRLAIFCAKMPVIRSAKKVLDKRVVYLLL